MRSTLIQSMMAAAVCLTLAFAGAAPASAQSVMKVCGDQWKAAKAAGTTGGKTWPEFLSACRASGATATPTAAPAPAPAPTNYAPTSGGVKTAKECDAEYSANKAAIKASGQKKRDFVESCRAGGSVATAPMAPAPAPAPTTSIFPWQKPAPETQPAPSTYAPAPAPTAARPVQPMSASEAQAQASCPGEAVVWLNSKSGIYHFRGTRYYGTTKSGTYICERAAIASGDRAAENEKHP
jgi:hypothetical protein